MLVARWAGTDWRDATAAALAARAEALEVCPTDADRWIHEAASRIPVLVRPPGTAWLPRRLLAAWGGALPRPGWLPVSLRRRRLDVALVRIVPALPFPMPVVRREFVWQGFAAADAFDVSSAYDGIRAHARDGDLIVLGARGGFLYGGFPADLAAATGRPVLLVEAARD
jgi:hypothetical protein